MYRVKTNRKLSDALREVAGSMNFEALLGGQPLRHDKNAVRVAKRLVLAEARRIEIRERSLARWDGQFPPPAVLRCPNAFREKLGPNVEQVSACGLLKGHDGACEIWKMVRA